MTRGIQLAARPLAPMSDVETRYYLRFQVFDRPGCSRASRARSATSASRSSRWSSRGRGSSSGEAVQVVILTHEAREEDVQRR